MNKVLDRIHKEICLRMTDIEKLLLHAEETRKLFLKVYSDDEDFNLLGRTDNELNAILRQENNLLKKNREELTILENFVKLREKGSEEKLQNEIKNFKEAKEQIISEMSNISGESEEKLRLEFSRMASI